jgi:hypothetical protein
MPDTNLNDNDLIQNAFQKSKLLGLNSFLIWNVKSAVLYKNNENNTDIICQWEEPSGSIKNRKDVESSEDLWKKMLHRILNN